MHERIAIDQNTHHGEPVIRGTRVPVAIIVGSLGGGMSFNEIEQEYGVNSDDIRAALKFAAETVNRDRYYPLSA